MEAPVTRYAKSGDINIAYQKFGSGPRKIVFAPGFVSHVEHLWDHPKPAHFLQRLAGMGEVVIFDKRGTGLSDHVASVATLDQRMDDIRAVMDAAGFDHASLIGISEGGAMCQLFAATHPARVEALVLIGAYGSFRRWVQNNPRFGEFTAMVDAHWGEGQTIHSFAPGMAGDPAFVQWWARYERLGGSPGAVKDLLRMNQEIDVCAIMPSIAVPTLILHRTGDGRVSIEAARFMANAIPNARLVECAGTDHLAFVGNVDAELDEVEEFITGARPLAAVERVLATVMFTDIVDSTRQAAALGDREWAARRLAHDQAVRAAIERQRGRVIKGLGDGFLATFDGPARAVHAALASATAAGEQGLPIRVGLHTGEIALEEADISGLAVAVASRVASLAQSGEVLVSSTVRDLVAGSGLRFADKGPQQLKGLEEPMRVFQALA
ncbi:MAG: adenylate/guanylate cyclase domain-containing protein [Reyranellaceae bacterium]